MILVLGGTHESTRIAEALALSGRRVLFSCATEVELPVVSHPNITRRTGALDIDELTALVNDKGINLIVDATHPYAAQAHATAREAAKRSGITCFSYIRPETDLAGDDLIFAANHEEGARIAFSFGKRVLLTTGVKNLAPYATQSQTTGIPLIVRVLPEPQSMQACSAMGIPEGRIIAARGPFTAAQNLEVIRRYSIGVIVTKDSGSTGGTAEKIEAARLEGCAIVVIRRPQFQAENTFCAIEDLVAAVGESKIG